MTKSRSLRSIATVLLAVLLLTATDAQARVALDRIFSDHMVLQRGMAVPVWGTATAGDKVAVKFQGQTKQTTAGKDGRWRVTLDPLKVGPAGELTVMSGDTVTLKDVLVGEVWVGSGQSNMAGRAGGYAKNDATLAQWIANGPYPKIRLYQAGWKVADPDTIKNFSAIHFSFGYSLHKELDVPVGLMVGAVGGTPSGRWLTEEMAGASPDVVRMMEPHGGFEMKAAHAKYAERVKAWEAEVKKAKAAGKKPPRKPRGPITLGTLYNRHIKPFVGYGIRGVLWDQGESRTQMPGVDQFTAMNALITGWRKVWGQGDFPFLHVQKPSGGGCAFDPENPINRSALPFTTKLPAKRTNPAYMNYHLDHVRIGTIKHAPLVIASDLAPGIHPATKSAYGQRACRVALGSVYGKDLVISGPTYKLHKTVGTTLVVSFNHVGKGLIRKHGDKLQGFEIAGADGQWEWADAVIRGDTVILSHKNIKKPAHVRYAFERTFNYANLFNKDGLPALVFTTQKP